MGASDGECMEGTIARDLQHNQLLFIWIYLGTEGRGGNGQLDKQAVGTILANGYVYVYAQANPSTFYDEPIVPMALSNVPVIGVSTGNRG